MEELSENVKNKLFPRKNETYLSRNKSKANSKITNVQSNMITILAKLSTLLENEFNKVIST